MQVFRGQLKRKRREDQLEVGKIVGTVRLVEISKNGSRLVEVRQDTGQQLVNWLG
jgi:hypothetical protein